MNQSEIILYRTEDGSVKIDTIFQDETIRLTQSSMAELFGVNVPAISKHLKNIYEEGELQKEATLSKMETVQNEEKLLTHAGTVKAEVAKKIAEERYEVFDKKRKIAEAKKADEEDLKELEEIEKRLLNNKDDK